VTKIINVLTIPEYRRNSARDRLYELLVRFDGKPIEEFVASVKRDHSTDGPALGWIQFFEKQGVLKLTSDAEYTKHVSSYADEPDSTIKGFIWFLWCTAKWLVISGVLFVVFVFTFMNSHPALAVIFGIVFLFIAIFGYIIDLVKPGMKKEEERYFSHRK